MNINLETFGKLTKRGWAFTQKDKDDAWEHLCSQRSTVTARHESRDDLERLAEVTTLIEELTAERKALLDKCEKSIVEVGKPIGDSGSKWVAFVQRKGKAFPFVLSITRKHKRADFSGWCKANGITAERVIAEGHYTEVAESKSIAPAGKTHIADMTRQHCLELVENK